MPQYEEYLKKLDYSYNNAKEVYDNKIKGLNKNIKDRDNKIQVRENSINDCTNRISQLEFELTQSQRDNKNAQSSIREKEGSLTTQESKIKHLEQRINNESSVNTNLKNEIIKLEDDLSNEKRKFQEEFVSKGKLNEEQVNLIKQNEKHKKTNNELIIKIQELEYANTLLNKRIKENTIKSSSESPKQEKKTINTDLIKSLTDEIIKLKKSKITMYIQIGLFVFMAPLITEIYLGVNESNVDGIILYSLGPIIILGGWVISGFFSLFNNN
jgi:chromosome segregation ATPase